ncbi:MAG TPA: hypothetical protein VF800_31445 [Telluria sp.]|jgi:hypothetical protein
MQANLPARRSIVLSLALIAAGVATAAYQLPRQGALAAEAEQRNRLAQAARMQVVANGQYMIESIAVDARGTLYISAMNEHRVYAMNDAGQRIEFTDRNAPEHETFRPERLLYPTALAADATGNLYVADRSMDTGGCVLGPRIKKIGPGGALTRLAHADAALDHHTAGLLVTAIAVDSEGVLYVQEWGDTFKLSSTGKRTLLAVPDSVDAAGEPAPNGGLAAHPEGGVIVANSRHGLYRVFPDGRAVTLETHGGDCALASPRAPVPPDFSVCGPTPDSACVKRVEAAQPVPCIINAVAVDAHGRIFLSDNSRILRVDTDGAMSTVFDPGDTEPMPLKNPRQQHGPATMALSPRGDIYWAREAKLYKITPWSRLLPL